MQINRPIPATFADAVFVDPLIETLARESIQTLYGAEEGMSRLRYYSSKRMLEILSPMTTATFSLSALKGRMTGVAGADRCSRLLLEFLYRFMDHYVADDAEERSESVV